MTESYFQRYDIADKEREACFKPPSIMQFVSKGRRNEVMDTAMRERLEAHQKWIKEELDICVNFWLKNGIHSL